METSLQNVRYCVNEVELIYKSLVKQSDLPTIRNSFDAYQIIKSHWDECKINLLEQSKLLLLNNACKVLAICELSSGGITGTVVDVRTVFQVALKANATSVILSHNHPSGSLKASNADKQVTQKIAAAGQLLDIKLFDHLIISSEGYFSFADNGEL
jgi:DNA repair protein RadC